MTDTNVHGYLSRRGKVVLWVTAVFGTTATLLYFEQIAVIYILSTLTLILLLLLVGFSDLENVGVKAQNEAYMTYRPEGVFPDSMRQRGVGRNSETGYKESRRNIALEPLTDKINSQ